MLTGSAFLELLFTASCQILDAMNTQAYPLIIGSLFDHWPLIVARRSKSSGQDAECQQPRVAVGLDVHHTFKSLSSLSKLVSAARDDQSY